MERKKREDCWIGGSCCAREMVDGGGSEGSEAGAMRAEYCAGAWKEGGVFVPGRRSHDQRLFAGEESFQGTGFLPEGTPATRPASSVTAQARATRPRDPQAVTWFGKSEQAPRHRPGWNAPPAERLTRCYGRSRRRARLPCVMYFWLTDGEDLTRPLSKHFHI